MSETTNYQLHLTDDASERFKDWREKINGTVNSNMVKIDAALGEKANKSTYLNTVLLASAWTGVEPPFVQVLQVEGLGEAQNGRIGLAHSATAEQREIAREAMLAITGQGDGTLTIVADGEMPEFDLPVTIIMND